MTKREEALAALEEAMDDCYLERGEAGPLIEAFERAVQDKEAEECASLVFVKMTGMKAITLYEQGEADSAARYVSEAIRARIAAREKK